MKELEKEEKRLNEKIEKATAARFSLNPGSSRARVTTANARLLVLLEARQRVWDKMALENNK